MCLSEQHCAFADLWGKLKAGKPWRGMVKTAARDGRYYWVDACVTIFEQGGYWLPVGPQSRRAGMKAMVKRTYARLKAWSGERKSGLSLRPMRHGLAIVGVLLMLAAI